MHEFSNNLKEECNSCKLGKSTRSPRKCKSKTATMVIERLYTDVVGTIQSESLNRSRFFAILLYLSFGYSIV